MDNGQQSEFQEQGRQLLSQLSSNDLQIVPQVKFNGEWMVPDSYLAKIWAQVLDEGLDKVVFLEKGMGLEQFIILVKNPNDIVGFLFKDKECVGFAWMNQLIGNVAHGHFCFFRQEWGHDTDAFGKMVLDYWFSFPGFNGRLLDVVFGVMPAFNKPAHKFVERIGFVRLGEVPGLLRRSPEDRLDAVIYYYSRD